jgi:hypothetical protein
MPTIENVLPFAVLAIFALFGWRYLKAGSLVGALLGGRIRDTVGEITLDSGVASSRTLKVHTLEVASGSEPLIALAITSKAPFGASVVPIKLTRFQTLELISLLQRASGT